MASRNHSTSKVITLVLAVAFGIIALAMTYSAATRSTEQRSRASPAPELIIKQWEFNGSTTEGWTPANFSSVRVVDGFLDAVYGKPLTKENPNCNNYQCQNRLYSKSSGIWMITDCNNPNDRDGDDQLCNARGRVGSCGSQNFCCPGPKKKWTTDMSACGGSSATGPNLVNNSVGAALPLGNKYLKFRLGVKDESKPIVLRREPGSSFTLSIMYTVEGKPVLKPLQVQGSADGQLHDYSVLFPEIAAITVTTLKLTFINLTPGRQVQFDWIRLTGVQLKPTPTPTITCHGGLLSFRIEKPCTPDRKSALYGVYQCADGFSGRLYNDTCQTIDSLKQQAERICTSKSDCPKRTPTPTPVQSNVFFIDSMYPIKTVMSSGEAIPISIVVKEPDGTYATPDEGFAAQAYIYDVPRTKTIAGTNLIESQNAYKATMYAPALLGSYQLSISVYCGLDNSVCEKRYGRARQIQNEINFEVQ